MDVPSVFVNTNRGLPDVYGRDTHFNSDKKEYAREPFNPDKILIFSQVRKTEQELEIFDLG